MKSLLNAILDVQADMVKKFNKKLIEIHVHPDDAILLSKQFTLMPTEIFLDSMSFNGIKIIRDTALKPWVEGAMDMEVVDGGMHGILIARKETIPAGELESRPKIEIHGSI